MLQENRKKKSREQSMIDSIQGDLVAAKGDLGNEQDIRTARTGIGLHFMA